MPRSSPTSLRAASPFVAGAVALFLFVLLGLRAAMLPAPAAPDASARSTSAPHHAIADAGSHELSSI
jgi:hypothetical protein